MQMMQIVCEQCETPLPDHEVRWWDRRFCSMACYHQNRSDLLNPPKACAFCGEVFRPGRSRYRFCSRKCANDNRRTRHTPVRSCVDCGALLVRRRQPAGKLEDRRRFSQRKRCYPRCPTLASRILAILTDRGMCTASELVAVLSAFNEHSVRRVLQRLVTEGDAYYSPDGYYRRTP